MIEEDMVNIILSSSPLSHLTVVSAQKHRYNGRYGTCVRLSLCKPGRGRWREAARTPLDVRAEHENIKRIISFFF